MRRRLLSVLAAGLLAWTGALSAGSPAVEEAGAWSLRAGAEQPAVCPATRSELSPARPSDGRSGVAAGTLLGLLPASPALGAISSARAHDDLGSRLVLGRSPATGRSSRGPPA